MHEYLTEAKTLRDSLRAIDSDPSEPALVLQVLNGLPADYDSIVNPLLAQTPLPSFQHIRSRVSNLELLLVSNLTLLQFLLLLLRLLLLLFLHPRLLRLLPPLFRP